MPPAPAAAPPEPAAVDEGWGDEPAAAAPAVATATAPTVGVLDRPTALARLATAADRDDVAEIAIAYARGHLRTSIVLIVRDGMALGHRGAGPDLSPMGIEAIAVPLQQPSVFKLAVDGRQAFVGTVPEGNALQDRFLKLFGGREIVVLPVVLGSRVACLFVGGGTERGLADVATDLRAITDAMAAAFLRIIRDAKQPGARP